MWKYIPVRKNSELKKDSLSTKIFFFKFSNAYSSPCHIDTKVYLKSEQRHEYNWLDTWFIWS